MIKYLILGMWLGISAWSFMEGDALWGWLDLLGGAIAFSAFLAIERRQ